MIKKLDKFILARFMGPFILAYAVVTFIFLVQHLIRYFQHFMGKDLGLMVFAELFSYFALMLTPIVLPLAVLLSALMSFGSLGEHSELTAIKGAGISLLRILRPVGAMCIFLTLGAIYFSDVISPEANLKAYSLLYDIKQKKPTLEFKEGAFYDGLPGYSIRIENKSGENGQELEGLMIYNHTARQGNTDLIVAERGRMYTIENGSHLVLEMINGKRYTDLSAERGRKQESEFLQNEFDSSKIVFDMESFGMKETKKELFKGHNMMKTASQLVEERDSMRNLREEAVVSTASKIKAYYLYQFKKDNEEAIERSKAKNIAEGRPPVYESMVDTALAQKNDSVKMHKTEVIRQKIDFSNPLNKNELANYMARKGVSPIDESAIVDTAAEEKVMPIIETIKPLPISLKNGMSLQKVDDSTNNRPAPTPVVTNTNDADNVRNAEDVRRLRQAQEQNPTRIGKGKKMVQVMPNPSELEEKPSSLRDNINYRVLNLAWSKANGVKISAEDVQRRVRRHTEEMNHQWIELNNRYARATMVFIMFLIGAPLGAIIKKGGLGVPILVSILFFIVYYVLNITGSKLATNEVVPVWLGCWGANALMLACGLFFLKKAYEDSRLFDSDYYAVALSKMKQLLGKKNEVA